MSVRKENEDQFESRGFWVDMLACGWGERRGKEPETTQRRKNKLGEKQGRSNAHYARTWPIRLYKGILVSSSTKVSWCPGRVHLDSPILVRDGVAK